METVSEIQSKIDAAEVELQDRQSQLAAAERKLSQIEAEFDEKSALAVNFKNVDAEKWLKGAKDEIAGAEFSIRTLRPAVREISERIIRLKADEAEATRAAISAEIDNEISAMLAETVALDGAIADFRRAQDAILLRRDRAVDLSRRIGRDDVRALENLPKHLQRNTNAQLFQRGGENPWMPRETRALYAQPFSKILEQMLKIGDQAEPVEMAVESTDAERQAS